MDGLYIKNKKIQNSPGEGVGMFDIDYVTRNSYTYNCYNPHNKHHSFGLFIPLYLCCVVDCINGNM